MTEGKKEGRSEEGGKKGMKARRKKGGKERRKE